MMYGCHDRSGQARSRLVPIGFGPLVRQATFIAGNLLFPFRLLTDSNPSSCSGGGFPY